MWVKIDREWCLNRLGRSRRSSFSASGERNPLASTRYRPRSSRPSALLTTTPSEATSTSVTRQLSCAAQPYFSATLNSQESVSWRYRWPDLLRMPGVLDWVASNGSGSSPTRWCMKPKCHFQPKLLLICSLHVSYEVRTLISGTS